MAFKTGSHQRFFNHQRRHCLTLHIGTHQCAVSIIMLQEWNQCCCYRHHLLWRHIHIVNIFRRFNRKFTNVTNIDKLIVELTFLINRGRGLSDNKIGFVNRRQIFDLISHLAVNHLPVRRLEKAVTVGTGIGCQGVDQTNIWTLGRFNRTHTTIMRRVYVTNLKTGALPGKTTWAQCRHATFVGNLRQRVVLVHKLGQLTGAEKFFHRSSHRLGIDQILGHQPFGFCYREALFDRALDTNQTNAELIFGHLTH